jgi:hypothetical protein
MSIVDENSLVEVALKIYGIIALPNIGSQGFIIRFVFGNGIRKLSRRGNVSIKDLSYRTATVLAG